MAAIDWSLSHKIEKLLKLIDEQSIKIDMACEAILALSAQLAELKSPGLIEPDKTIELPTMPLRSVEEVSNMNFRLSDEIFLDQMVSIFGKFLIYVNL